MKPDEIKSSIENIKPDVYMEQRLSEKISDFAPQKRSKRKIAVAAISGILSFAVLVTGLGFGSVRWNSSGTERITDNTLTSSNMFIMSVRAAESEDDDYVPIDSDMVVLQDCHIISGYDEDGYPFTKWSSSSDFSVKGENIKSVSYECETGTFYVCDWDLREYLIQNGEFYDAIVPYTDEYVGKYVNERADIMFNHIKNGDYDEYLTKPKRKSAEDYAGVDRIYYDDVQLGRIKIGFDIDESGLEEDSYVALGIVSMETYSKTFPSGVSEEDIKNYTFQNYLNKKDEIGTGISWNPNINALLEDPDMPKSEIPHDTVTVKVTFNDGTVQVAKYDFSFNDNGELVINTL